MKKLILTSSLVTILVSVLAAQTTLDALRKKAEEALGKKQPSSDRVAAGLKEALTVGTRNAVASTGRVDGFLKNAAIKILLPEKLRGIGKGLRAVGMGQQVDSLEVGMNRAAEQAAPAAKQIFINAVKQMTISDARQILSGGDTAATDYFKSRSTDQLTAAFAPIVHKSMENVGVVRQYNKLMQNPLAGELAQSKDFDLDQYVVGKTMDGLFYMIGEEEKKIRHDPAAQTTALLREIFGNKQQP
ncbi:MAG TPA: DUF4197 domain-containing protein [Candidatus Angelobacter sp.]|nr:DUF4197 domain-containing protein [Candidatus Angelobacter sp.]